MRIDNPSLFEGSVFVNLVVDQGTQFPVSNVDAGELFFRTDTDKLHVFDGTSTWIDTTATAVLGTTNQVDTNAKISLTTATTSVPFAIGQDEVLNQEQLIFDDESIEARTWNGASWQTSTLILNPGGGALTTGGTFTATGDVTTSGIQTGTSDFEITNNVNSGNVEIRARNAGGTEGTVANFTYDVTTFYDEGEIVLTTFNNGLQITNGAGTVGPQLTFQEKSVNRQAILWYDITSNVFDLRAEEHSAHVTISGEDTGGVVRTMIDADPDGAVDLYFGGTKHFETTALGTSTTLGRHTVNPGSDTVAQVQAFSTVGGISMRVDTTTALGRIAQLNGSGVTEEDWITMTRNGAVSLRHNGIEMARTILTASGGFEVNNTSTGAGFERVLTTSDLGGSTPTDITVADSGADTTTFIGLWPAATGDLGPKTDASITYNASTNVLTVPNITGTASQATNATNIGVTTTATNASFFPTFTATSSGNNPPLVDGSLTYNPSTNTLTATTFAGIATNATAADTITIASDNTNATRFLSFVDSTSGDQAVKVDGSLTYNPSLNTITTGFFSGNGSSLTAVPAVTSLSTSTNTNATFFPVFHASTSGQNASNVDSSFQYNPSLNTLTVTNLTASGTISGTVSDAANANGITPVATNTSSIHYPVFTSSTSGVNTPNIDTGFTYNPGTNLLSAVNFAGSGASLTSVPATTTLTTTTNVNAVHYLSFVGSTSGQNSQEIDTVLTYNPSTNVMTINGNNVLVDGGSITASDVTIGSSGNSAAQRYLPTVENLTGDQAFRSDSGLTYQESSNTLTATTFSGTATNASVAATVTVGATGNSGSIRYVPTYANLTGDQAPQSDAGLTYIQSSNTLNINGFAALTTNSTITATNININASSNSATPVYVVTSDGLTGTNTLESDSGLTWRQSDNTLFATTFSGTATLATTTNNVTLGSNGNSASDYNIAHMSATTGSLAIAGDSGLRFVPSSNILKVTGAMLGGAGTVSLPEFAFESDPNTGMYNSTADELSFATGGTRRLTIESNGTLNVSGTTTYETLVTADDDIPNKKYVDDKVGFPDLGEFVVASLPAAGSNASAWALATDASGGRTVVRSDGTNWKVIAVEGATVTT